jgi:hypothetical protein
MQYKIPSFVVLHRISWFFWEYSLFSGWTSWTIPKFEICGRIDELLLLYMTRFICAIKDCCQPYTSRKPSWLTISKRKPRWTSLWQFGELLIFRLI